MNRRPALVLLALLASGCTLGPDYQRPEMDLPAAYRQPADAGESLANLPWWELFDDPRLRQLIEAALAGNKDLAIAAARVEEARARLGFVRADQLPRVDIAGQAQRGDPGASRAPAGIQSQYRLAADLSFELDLWGRLRRSTEAARAELLASEEARRVVLITLISDVASAYLLLRDADERLLIAERTLASREESLRIIRARFDRGTVPMLDVSQAEIERAEAAAEVAALRREIVQTENLINVLVGRKPGPVLRERGQGEPLAVPRIPAGLPAELLERRPDIRQAERALAAQTARIGAAEALRLPTLRLTGAFGLASDELSSFVDGDAVSWNLGAGLLGPLFDAGQSGRRVDVERARTERLLRAWERAVLQGLREVEDALVAVRSLGEELAAREAQLAAARNAARLSRARYDGGVTSYLEVLDSERSLFTAELLVSSTRRAQLVAVVQLYKALGGGWEATAAEGAGAAEPAAADGATGATPAAARGSDAEAGRAAAPAEPGAGAGL